MASPKKPSVAYIGLGSNLGDRRGNLKRGLREIQSSEEVRLLSVSGLYLTKPVEVRARQSDYLNAVVKIETSLGPEELLGFLKEIEGKLGRVPDSHLEPRSLDLDILLFDDLVIEGENLTIPHPRLADREFVLAPLLELQPELENPVDGERLSHYYKKLKGSQGLSVHEHKSWWRG